ncbi:MAG: hypothetical protein OEX82_00575 [Nitrosomonas sp.]|nr:hypothetical protein [Nitrosomonas sp.]
MKYLIFLVWITFIPTLALASDFGVSINIGQPGFYGQINLGNNYPRPQVIYPQPVLVREVRRQVWEHQSPVYLHVPPQHSSNWHQHCHRYQACNLSVYFVRENWYNDVYSPHYNNYSNRRRNVGYQDQHYDSDHHDHGYQERRHDNHYQERRYDSHNDHYQDRRRDKKRHNYDDDHRGKHDKGHKGKKNRDKDHGRH